MANQWQVKRSGENRRSLKFDCRAFSRIQQTAERIADSRLPRAGALRVYWNRRA